MRDKCLTDGAYESGEPFRVLLAVSSASLALRVEQSCRSHFWLVVEPAPDRAIGQIRLVQFNVIAVDFGAVFSSWENVLNAAAKLSPHSGRLLVYDGTVDRPLPPAAPWLYHDTLDANADPELVRRRLYALSAGAESLRTLDEDR